MEKLHFGKRVVNIDYSGVYQSFKHYLIINPFEEEKIHLKLQNAVEAHNGFEKWPDSFDFIIVSTFTNYIQNIPILGYRPNRSSEVLWPFNVHTTFANN